MESVIFDGKEYIKASVLAERFNYTQDYLGQLCRAKKVDARLVGRAWYLNLDSLQGHKKTRYKSPEKLPVDPKKPTLPTPQHFLTRIDVESVLKKKTVKILKNNKAGKLNEYAVKYENDDYSLIPRVNRTSVSKPINILPADSDDLSVKASKESVRVTTFKAEPLPEVYLKGTLKVDGIPEAMHGEVEAAVVTRGVTEAVNLGAAQTILPAAEINNHGQTDVKKRIKIKLYRQNNTKLEVKKTPVGVRPLASISKQKPIPEMSQQSQFQPRPTLRNEIKVKMAVETVTVVGPPKAAEIQEIPHANLKAFIILAASFFLASVSLLPKQEVKYQAGSLVQTWEISSTQLQEVWTFLTSFLL